MSAQPRTKKSAKPASAESRTALLPGMLPPLAPPRPPLQLAFAVALGEARDQLVMPGCDDAATDPRRVYRPADDGGQ